VTLSVGRAANVPEHIVPGTYVYGPQADWDFVAALPTIAVIGVGHVPLDPASTEGQVEVTVIEPDRVCGRFEFHGDKTRIEGAFAAVGGPPEAEEVL
jgi:hypothetical protein